MALAKLALGGANFLLLDEPTNHLDIDSQEILQNVLADFAGTILLVSHDRYLIDALATQIWAVSPGELDVFKGTYQEYLAARTAARQAAAVAERAASAGEAGERLVAVKIRRKETWPDPAPASAADRGTRSADPAA